MKKVVYVFLVALLVASCKSDKEKKSNKTTPEPTEIKGEKPVIKNVDVEWTAFKTLKKVGVAGTFLDVKYGEFNVGKTLEEQFIGLSFVVNKATVNTKDAARDNTLKTHFFDNLIGDISGVVLEPKDGKMPIEISLNNQEALKMFDYTVSEDGKIITLAGSIDILSDFSANKAFDALHEACKALHEGKTWTGVAIKAVITLE